jgi:hypothetical protein
MLINIKKKKREGFGKVRSTIRPDVPRKKKGKNMMAGSF